MKKTIYLLVIFLISLNAIAFAKSHDIIENISVDEEILYTYWTNYKSQIRPFGEEREPTNAFVADIDNDKEPELIVFFSYLGPGGPTFSVYKNDKGNIYLDGHIMTNSGTGIHHDLKLFLENCGELKVVDHYFCYPYYELGTQSVTLSRYESKSTVIEKYAEANYMDEIYYTTSVSGENKKYCTRQEADEFIDDFYSNINHNVVFSSESEDKTDIDFFEIWNMQKQLRKTVNVLLDNKEISFDQPPIIVDGRTLVPLRAIFEELGATVNWDGNTQTVTSTKGQTTISMSIGKNKMYKNGEIITLDVAPQLVGGRTLVPVRAVAEGFDCKVEWDGNTQTVFIITKSEIAEPYKEIANYASKLCFIVEEQGGEEYFNQMISNNELTYDALNELDDAIDFQETVLTLEGGALEISKTVLKFATGNYAGATKEIAGALVSSGSDVMFAALKKSVPDMKSFIYNMGITACEKQQFDIDNLKLLHSKIKSRDYTEGDAISYIYLYYQMMINNENSNLSISLLQTELPQGFLESLKESLKEAAGVFMPSISGDFLDLDLPTEVMMSILEEYASFVCGETNDFYAKMIENINNSAVKEWSENVQSYTNAINEKLSTIK